MTIARQPVSMKRSSGETNLTFCLDLFWCPFMFIWYSLIIVSSLSNRVVPAVNVSTQTVVHLAAGGGVHAFVSFRLHHNKVGCFLKDISFDLCLKLLAVIINILHFPFSHSHSRIAFLFSA
jgi:hypothetical protein